MSSNNSKIATIKEFLEAFQCAEGKDLTCQQLMEIVNNRYSSVKIVFGDLQSLNYGTDGCDSPELQKVILSDTTEGEVQIISKCDADNLNDYERILKNAADFGHEIFAIIKDKELISVTLRTSKPNTENIIRSAFGKTKPGTNPSPFG